MSSYLWVKAVHVVFVTSWFAGLLYVPRIFVNLASVEDVATHERLLLMARKLLRFMTLLSLVAIVLGLWLLGHGAKAAGWMHAKLVLVALLIGYHGWCALLLLRFASGRNSHSHVWFRWFNEIPVLLLFAIVVLAVVKPF